MQSMKVSEEKIIEAAFTLFKQRGFRSTSLQYVARACGTSLWEVNLLFKSKKDLLLTVVRHVLNKKAVYLLISSSLSPSAVTELNTFFKFVEDTIGALGADILAELKRHSHALDHVKDIVEGTLMPTLQKNIQRGLSEGFYRAEVDAALYTDTYFYILRTVLESERDWSETKKVIKHINAIFLHGVLNAKGMRI